MKKKEFKQLNVSEFEDEYAYDGSIWNQDPDDIAKLKKIISELPTPERRLIILYAETASLRTVSKQLGVSLAITADSINKVKQKIKDKFNAIP